MEIVVNKRYGRFGLSRKAIRMYLEAQGKDAFFYRGITGYKEIDDESPDSFFCHTVTKDLGDVATQEEISAHYFSDSDIPRDDAHLVRVVKSLGDEANGRCARLQVVEIPDGVSWMIDGYDGMESIHEQHRAW